MESLKGNSGDTVQIGSKTLKILSVEKARNGLTDIYHLTSLDGTKDYQFIPYSGLRRM